MKSPWNYIFQLCIFGEYFVSIKLRSKKNGKLSERKTKPVLDGSLVADSQVKFCKNCTLKVIS